MQTKKIVNSLIASALLFQFAKGQDIHFSQYAETPSSINPALAGVTYNTRIVANFKTQWGSVGTQYQTIGLSFDQTIKHKKLRDNYFAIAANIFQDQAGDARMKTLNPNLGFTYLQKINKKMKISGGIQSGLFYRTIDITQLRWGEQYNGYSYNAELPSGEPNVPRSSITSFDIGGGINLNSTPSLFAREPMPPMIDSQQMNCRPVRGSVPPILGL